MNARRSRLVARRRSRGAALFVVTAMLAVLAGLGAFAVGSVLSDVRTGASLRLRAQARYVADIALASALAQIRPDNAYLLVHPMLDTTRSDHRDATNRCVSLSGVPVDGSASALSRACARRLPGDYLNPAQAAELGNAFGNGSGWNYLVEITEPTELQGSVGTSATVPICDLSFTVSAFGGVGPRNGAGLATPVITATSMQVERVRYVIPGVPCSR